MSSRIEKGGARFKPSIVPRRSAGGAAASSSATTSSPTTSQQTSAQQSAAGTATAPPPSPSFAPQSVKRPARAPAIRKNASAATSQADVSPVSAKPAATTQPISTPSSSQSYAFNISPSVISKPGSSSTSRTSITAGQASASAAKPKPVFRRPSVSKPRPGSRASLTPAPQFAQPAAPAQFAAPALPYASASTLAPDADAAAAAAAAAGRDEPSKPPATTSTKSKAVRAGAGRKAPVTPASASQNQDPVVIDKASQPDPVQAPKRTTRARATKDTTLADVAAIVKASASQTQHVQSSAPPQEETASAPTAAQLPATDATVAPTSRSKGKAREITDTSTALNGRSTPQVVKPGSQAANGTAEEEDPQEKAARAAKRRIDAAARFQKRRLKRKEQSSGKPKRPLSAYLLFVNSVRAGRQAQNPDMSLTQITSEIAAEWRQLAPAQRTKWEAEASLLRQQYDSNLEAWKLAHPEGISLGPEDESDLETTSEVGEDGEPVRRKKRRVNPSRKARTVSDDEEEYRRQIYEEGEQLAASRIDAANMTMADLSAVDFRKGRAGPRTFEAERVYNRLVSDRRAAARSAMLGEHVLGDKVDGASPSPAPAIPAARILRTTNGAPVEIDADEEEVVGDQTGDDDDDASEPEESAPETDADGTTDGEGGASGSARRARRKREASVAATDVSFRENRFAVQTRIVDGKIVLDETSLFANYGNGEDDRDNMEVVDEREGDRFVNAATYSRKLGRNRKWSADETAKFYRSLQQWGTDFEMIARLFPGRDRVMIKKKFNVEERSNGKLVDAALKNSIPVNLEAYAQAIGVDLSGPPPEIKADMADIESLMTPAAGAGAGGPAIKKREGTAPISGKGKDRSDVEDTAGETDGDDGYEYEEVVEVDDDGHEQVIRRRLGRKPGSTAKGRKRRNSTRKGSTSTPGPASAPASASAALPASNSGSAKAASAAASEGDASEGAKGSRSGGPPSIGTRKSTRASRSKKAKAADHSQEAPGDGMEVEEIVGEL